MFRMVAKIAYEWYCAKNNVSGYYQEFANIVAYITKEEGIRKILFHNINNITKASLLHKISIFNLYILYIIGKSEIEVIDDEILSNEKYSDILERGAILQKVR